MLNHSQRLNPTEELLIGESSDTDKECDSMLVGIPNNDREVNLLKSTSVTTL